MPFKIYTLQCTLYTVYCTRFLVKLNVLRVEHINIPSTILNETLSNPCTKTQESAYHQKIPVIIVSTIAGYSYLSSSATVNVT